MSLRARLGLAIVGLVAVLILASWAAGGAALRPLRKQLEQDLVGEAMLVAVEVEEGRHLKELSETHGASLVLKPRPPPRGDWQERDDTERRTFVGRKGRRAGVAVETDRGWLIVHRELDVHRPGRVLPGMLLLVGLAVGGVALWAGVVAVRPVEQATEAMDRIAEGDLEHRLEPTGPPELQRVATAFNTMADRIDGMLRAEKEMFAGLSHDLRTPLTRLRLEVELLRDGGVPAKRVDAMEGDLAEIEGLIAAMLELSRLQLGHTNLSLQEVDLADLAREASRGAAVSGEGRARVDRALVLRALRNLLDNASRYASEPSIEVEGPTLVVRDKGPGVPEELLPSLFDPFTRADRSRASKGHGLGLMIVAQVARLHGGSVSARNLPEGGLEVRLSLSPGPA